MNKIAPLFLVAFLFVVAVPAAGEEEPVRKMAVERLPDLNRPRTGCVVALGPDGNPVVFGGHTTGFIRTATAEFYADGAWHEIEMLYPHDSWILLYWV